MAGGLEPVFIRRFGVRIGMPPCGRVRHVENPAIDYPAHRRPPGGLRVSVLYLVGDGYDTSLKVAALLLTSVDNVNGALRWLEDAGRVKRWPGSPLAWTITETGRHALRAELAGDEPA